MVPNRSFYGKGEECKRPYGANTDSRGCPLNATNTSVTNCEFTTSDRSGNCLHKTVRGNGLNWWCLLRLASADSMDTFATGIINSYWIIYRVANTPPLNSSIVTEHQVE